MRKAIAILGVSAALAVSAHTASADDGGGVLDHRDYRLTGGLFVGGNLMSDELELGNSPFDDQVPGSGFLTGARLAFVVLPHLARNTSIDPRVSVEAEGRMLFASTSGNGMRPSKFAPVIGWRLHAVVDFWPRAVFTPFLLVGGGGETLFGKSPFVATPDTDAAFHGGLGGRVHLGARYGIRGDIRAGVTAARRKSATPLFEAHLGLYYRFGWLATQERTSLLEQPPAAVPEPPKPAPEPAPEPTDGDNDGVFGDLDQCPDQPEDIDEFEDQDGCPDSDNDGDGIPDASDKCPAEPETQNNYQDDDGCADTVPDQVAQFTGTIPGIRFKNSSTRILSRSRSVLNTAVILLIEHPTVRIEISGHTDSLGSKPVNLDLSQRRAERVKDYLVENGIAADRIEAVGHGARKPIASNGTVRGRAKNRRIEFRLLGTAAPAPAPAPAPPAAPELAPPAAPELAPEPEVEAPPADDSVP